MNIGIQFNYVKAKLSTLSSVMLVKQMTPCLRDPSPDGSGRRAGGTLKFKVAGTLPRPSNPNSTKIAITSYCLTV